MNNQFFVRMKNPKAVDFIRDVLRQPMALETFNQAGLAKFDAKLWAQLVKALSDAGLLVRDGSGKIKWGGD